MRHSPSDSFQPIGEEEEDPYTTSVGNLMDSRTSHLDDLLSQKLEEALQKTTSVVSFHDIAKIASEYDPIDLAHAVPRLPLTARYMVYDNLPDLQSKIVFMSNTDSVSRSAIFRAMNDQELKRLIDTMPLDEAVYVLDDLSDRRLRRVLELLDTKKAQRIRDLLSQDRTSATRLMSNEFFLFPMQATIQEVAGDIRDHPGVELHRSVFVSNDFGQLIGHVPTRNLLVNPPETVLRQIMRPVLHKIRPDTTRDEVVDIVERYKIPSLPVVDENDVLIGVIQYEVVVEAIEDMADKTIANMAGTTEEVGEEISLWRRVLARAPWLFVTLSVGIATSITMGHFRKEVWFAIVPLFVTLITGMSGNVGLQCSTVLVRGMSTGELSIGSRGEAIRKELLIGLTIGLSFGLLSATMIYLSALFHPVGLTPIGVAMTVGCGVLGACLTATGLGVLFPFLFARLGVDPAIASGPLVTACNDFASTLVYFFIAWALFGRFIA